MSSEAVAPAGAYASAQHTRVRDWLTTTDHKRIGILYIASALVFFLIAVLFAMLMRTQLIKPNNDFLTPEQYNQIFSMHGTTMVFLFGMPILIGFANYLVPLMIGARDMAFPRMNMLSYWAFLSGGLLLYSSFLFGGALDTGWFSYAPLTETAYSPHDGVTFWIISLAVLGVSSLLGSVNFIVTMLRLRAPGMTWLRMPVFAQATYINSFLILFAIPSLSAAIALLYLDRLHGTTWFNVNTGGDPVIWQHLFWFFGHPEVYILILPAFGMMSEVVPIYSRKVLFGRTTMVIMLAAIGFLGFLVWAHHMFAVGLPTYFNTIMAGTSMLIAIPTGVKIFNWLATMWGGSLRFKTPLLFACGLIALFTVGGISGVMQAVVPFDWQVTDTFFIVGHLHNVLFAGTVFGVFAGFYYWFPKMSGRLLDDRLGKWHFWVMAVGFSLTFLPMYALGLLGMPRRVYTYASNVGWNDLNLVSSIGGYILSVSIAIFVVNVVRSLRSGELAGDDPWDAWTLEWATTSPPPSQNFSSLPPVHSPRPLWDLKHPEAPDEPAPADAGDGELAGTPGGGKDGAAHGPVHETGHATALPLYAGAAITIMAVGLLSALLVSIVGILLLFVVVAVWLGTPMPPAYAPHEQGERFSTVGLAMLVFLGSEVVFFASLIAAYVHLRVHSGVLTTDPGLELTLPIVNTVILLSSGVMAHFAQTSLRKGRSGWFTFYLVMAVALGAVFLGIQAWEYTHAGFGLSSGVLGSGFFTLTGFHGAHVTVGILLLVYLFVRITRQRRAGAVTGDGGTGMIDAGTYYWHFVDA
ncbi:MAG TPA: cytochrome c oxidase subunit I, partial [Thermoleophilia bacterium]|nr:cytochrome c oxidase subunit I [Thermoleophilia bacterium]